MPTLWLHPVQLGNRMWFIGSTSCSESVIKTYFHGNPSHPFSGETTIMPTRINDGALTLIIIMKRAVQEWNNSTLTFGMKQEGV